MICVGIDVAKDKHDCFILNSEGEVLADVFTIPNNAEGFHLLLQTIYIRLPHFYAFSTLCGEFCEFRSKSGYIRIPKNRCYDWVFGFPELPQFS